MLSLVLGFSEACTKRPTTVPPTPIIKMDLERCIGKNHSFPEKEAYHVVQKGETLYRISKTYGVSLEEIVRVNGIDDPSRVSTGQKIIIPRRSVSSLIWPVRGGVSSRFGKRGWRHFHSGIDIPAPKGTPIKAVAGGLVVVSGKSLDGYSRYGKIVIIEHGDGIRTVYAHNEKNLVKAGECVKAGEVIAEVGSSGNASGSHVHFEIRKGGKPVDPIKYLP